MEKKQYELMVEVLRRLQNEGVLDKLIITGSWSLLFYRDYFQDKRFYPSIRTRDLDFVIPMPFPGKKKVNVPELLKDLGFVVSFEREQGYMRLMHPALIMEFLVAEKGRGSSKPRRLPELGVNAQSLRYLNYLEKNVLSLNFEALRIKVPHPAVFALHKLLIMNRRRKEEKKEKDKKQAKVVLMYLIKNNLEREIRGAIRVMHPKWFKDVLKNLKKEKEVDLLSNIERIAGLNIEGA